MVHLERVPGLAQEVSEHRKLRLVPPARDFPESVRCPFYPCTARVSLKRERAVDLGTPAMIVIVTHDVSPDEWFGECPASGMGWPTNEVEDSTLIEQARVFDVVKRSRNERQKTQTLQENPRPAGRHPLTPMPSSDRPKYFANSQPGDPKQIGPLGYEQIKPATPAQPKGDGVASVAEVQAAINIANEAIEKTSQALSQALADADDAARQMAWIRSNVVDPLGSGMVSAVREEIPNLVAYCAQAIEMNNEYRRSM